LVYQTLRPNVNLGNIASSEVVALEALRLDSEAILFSIFFLKNSRIKNYEKVRVIGYPLSHSFSVGYFAEKFKRERIRIVNT